METLANLFGPLHPPMAHFPIVCSILAAAAFGWGLYKKEDWLFKPAAILWVLTLATAVPCLLFGHLFTHHLGMYSQWSLLPPDNVLKGQLRFHALLGTLGLVISILTFWGAVQLLRSKPFPPNFQLFLGLALAILFGLAGHEGGEMTYGEEGETQASTPAPSKELVDFLALAGDYHQRLVKVNATSWNSRTHGHRWVNTFVSKEAVTAYKNSDDLPLGSLVVKESFEDKDGKPSEVPGPLYMMAKGKVSDSPWTDGWKYAMTWERPIAGNPEKLQAPVTWLPGDPNLSSCIKCHNHFKSADEMGGVPDEALAP